MKIVIDSAIPFVKGVFEPFAQVLYKDGVSICRDDIIDADALMIRTRTCCNAALLEGTAVKIIATATIGTDHIDLQYCESRGIFVQNAAGCNSGGVMNYVFSALYGSASRRGIDLNGLVFGIVGVGNVGSRVESMARFLGFKVLLCDPPRAEREGGSQFVDLDTLLRDSDIVSLHVPLTPQTRGMADEGFFSRMKMGAFFINAARGEVVVDEALVAAIPKLGPVIIDTWNGEPDINRELLGLVDIATPHIAGYSYQGKLMGTAMSVRALAHFFGIVGLYEFYPDMDLPSLDAVRLDFVGKSQGETASLIQYNYPIFTDDFLFRTNPEEFEEMRKNYHYRREFYI
ncbi:MAG: 4-phosphoerythronate dehydrogenase [Bacteroidales bacterium]|nr:4-phosphoerythronate dehydrogenase [Bacteroidales bacterium]